MAIKLDTGLMTGAEGADEVGSATRRAAEAPAGMIAEADALGPAGATAAAQFRDQLAGLIPQIEAVGGALQTELADNFRSSFVDALTGGQNAFGAFADFLKRKLAELAYDRFISPMLTPLFDGLAGLFGSAKGNVIPFARGGLPGIDAFENQIVARPTLFGMGGNRTGLMGEAGAEAIMPLKGGPGGLGVLALGPNGPQRLGLGRGPGGDLAVLLPDVDDLAARVYARGGVVGGGGATAAGAAGSGAGAGWPEALLGALRDLRSTAPQVIVDNTAADAAEASAQVTMDGGTPIIEVLIEKVAGRLGQDLRRGGPFARNLETTYGLGRRGT